MTSPADSIEIIEWDTRFFGQKIARLTPVLPIPSAEIIDEFCQRNAITMVQACVKTDDIDSIFALENSGFHFVDIKITLGCPTSRALMTSEKNKSIFLSTEADIEQLRAVSDKSYAQVSRYNWRNAFAASRINDFYNLWMENGVKGLHDDFCLHYADSGVIKGFISVNVRNNSANAGLMAVGADYRGQGIADILVGAMVAYAAEHNIANVGTVVLGKNLPAHNLYIKNGLRLRNMESWYYKRIGA